MIVPQYIKPGDKVAIISPATEVKPYWIDGAVAELEARGYRPVVMPHAKGPACGTFASTGHNRLADLKASLKDSEIKMILCARGGYGAIHLLSEELEKMVRDNPKWIVGFSDISALHALWLKAGVMSLHCSMAKQLTLYNIEEQESDICKAALSETPDDEELMDVRRCTDIMFDILEGRAAEIIINYVESSNLSHIGVSGVAEGRIVGGNLAVLNGLAATPWDILSKDYVKGKILFLEDVGERIYQVDRMLTRLHLAGVFESAAGVVFGRFTEYNPDKNASEMEHLISSRLREWVVGIPVAFDFPIGHISRNLPVPEGASARLEVAPQQTKLTLGF